MSRTGGEAGAGYLILGCGFTGSRVARSLVKSGASVVCTNRQRSEIAGADCIALDTSNEQSLADLSQHLSPGMIVLFSIPAAEGTAILLDALRPFHPSRFVYLSTTGVYGAAEFVNEETIAAPDTERDRERLQTEQLISSGPWSALVLRPAAIYGPHRGVHTSARNGLFRPPPGGNRIISRIHVDDLAEHALAALRSETTGVFPVADQEPCTSLALAEWTCRFLDIPLELGEREATEREGAKKGRRVDGSAIRRALGIGLRYPSFREGVPACLKVESAEAN